MLPQIGVHQQQLFGLTMTIVIGLCRERMARCEDRVGQVVKLLLPVQMVSIGTTKFLQPHTLKVQGRNRLITTLKKRSSSRWNFGGFWEYKENFWHLSSLTRRRFFLVQSSKLHAFRWNRNPNHWEYHE